MQMSTCDAKASILIASHASAFGYGFKLVHSTLHGTYDYLSILGLKLIQVSKMVAGNKMVLAFVWLCVCHIIMTSKMCPQHNALLLTTTGNVVHDAI